MMRPSERTLAWVALSHLPKRREFAPHRLVEQYGPPNTWLLESADRYPDGVAALVERIDWAKCKRDANWLDANGCEIIDITADGYPLLLREIADPPAALFCRGRVPAVEPTIAIVGSRRASAGGLRAARDFGAELARRGVCVISGLAVGIDTAAHSGAVGERRPTVAVLGSGLAKIYPRQNSRLADTIIDTGGAIVTEYPPFAVPRPEHFPHRNRVISGMSLGVVVVEAAERSGSLITARLAADQGREVFAIPGAVANPLSRGCHRLLKEGAILAETAADVLAELPGGWSESGPFQARTDSASMRPPGVIARDGPTRSLAGSMERARSEAAGGVVIDESGLLDGAGDTAVVDVKTNDAASADAAQRQISLRLGGESERQAVLQAVDFVATRLDEVADRTGLTADVVSAILLSLELEGRIHADLGGGYTRL